MELAQGDHLPFRSRKPIHKREGDGTAAKAGLKTKLFPRRHAGRQCLERKLLLDIEERTGSSPGSFPNPRTSPASSVCVHQQFLQHQTHPETPWLPQPIAVVDTMEFLELGTHCLTNCPKKC